MAEGGEITMDPLDRGEFDPVDDQEDQEDDNALEWDDTFDNNQQEEEHRYDTNAVLDARLLR